MPVEKELHFLSYVRNFLKRLYTHCTKVYAKYHDPSSIGSPNRCILFIKFHMVVMQKLKKWPNFATTGPSEEKYAALIFMLKPHI